jgi:hypothetical protein
VDKSGTIRIDNLYEGTILLFAGKVPNCPEGHKVKFRKIW